MSTAGAPDGPTRRSVVALTTLTAAAAAAGASLADPAPPQSASSAPYGGMFGSNDGSLFCLADTAYGKVQGVVSGGIREFKGIPYGAPTGGRNRYMPPRAPKPWTGVREAIAYGSISPQRPPDLRSQYTQLIMWDRHVGCGGLGEDCLSLNIWTPGTDNAKRAVLVSLHGGGFTSGSGNGPMFDGGPLASFGDVVVVTVNHRLGANGFLNLAGLGAPPEFADAGVCGLMDIVTALEWVRDNIAGFGGDPSRVMVFGQSGGGMKTSALLASPLARGLFHRAAIQSGSVLRLETPEQATRTAELVLAELGIPRSRISDIQKVSWQRLLEAQVAVAAKGSNFLPVVGRPVLPRHPFDPVAPAESAHVPLIISTTLEDLGMHMTNFELDAKGLVSVIESLKLSGAGAATDLYLRSNPGKTPFQIQAQALTDATFRKNALVQAERRAALGGAPTWMYLWQWATPAFDGKFGAVHGHDVDASFHLVRSPICGAGMAPGRLMADRLASAWVTFAKTGDPNNALVPDWPPYGLKDRATMVFDTDMRVENDPRSELRKIWS